MALLAGCNLHALKNSGINQMNKNSGTFIAQDTLGNPITLDWQAIPGQTDELCQKIKSIAEILVPAYTKTEVAFAHKDPSLVSNDFMIKSLSPLLEQDSIDWKLFEQKTQELLEEFFETTDWKAYSNEHDLNIFITARDQKTGKNSGVIQFISSSDFATTTIKAALYGVIPEFQNRGIEQLLMSAIFKLRPDIQRIFLHTRSSNEQEIAEYKSWGFTQFEGKLPNWTDLEYLVEKSDILQNKSQQLKD